MGIDRVFATPTSLVVPAGDLYEIVPLDPAKKLTQQEQEYISALVAPPDYFALKKAMELGVHGSLKVEVTFSNGHKGGLLLRRR